MAAHHDENMGEDDYLALGSFLYDLADRIFPESPQLPPQAVGSPEQRALAPPVYAPEL